MTQEIVFFCLVCLCFCLWTNNIWFQITWILYCFRISLHKDISVSKYINWRESFKVQDPVSFFFSCVCSMRITFDLSLPEKKEKKRKRHWRLHKSFISLTSDHFLWQVVSFYISSNFFSYFVVVFFLLFFYFFFVFVTFYHLSPMSARHLDLEIKVTKCLHRKTALSKIFSICFGTQP